MSAQQLVILVRSGDSCAVLSGGDRAACQAALTILADGFGGRARAHLDTAQGAVRCAGGQELFLWSAEVLESPAHFAVVLTSAGLPALVYLVADKPTANFVSAYADRSIYRAQIVPLASLTQAASLAGLPPPGSMADIAGEGNPRVLSTTFCSRCQDHPLHLDPLFDDRSRLTGERICNACGVIEALRLDRQAA